MCRERETEREGEKTLPEIDKKDNWSKRDTQRLGDRSRQRVADKVLQKEAKRIKSNLFVMHKSNTEIGH